MGKLLEVVRRLAVSLVWVFGGFFSFSAIMKYYRDGMNIGGRQNEDLYFALACFFGAIIVHQLINWKLLKNEKNAPPGN